MIQYSTVLVLALQQRAQGALDAEVLARYCTERAVRHAVMEAWARD